MQERISPTRFSHKELFKIMQSCKDLLERIPPGSSQDLLTRTCARSCKDLLGRTSPGSPQDLLTRAAVLCHKSHFMRACAGKWPHPTTGTSVLCEPAQSKCTWTCQKSNSMQEIAIWLAGVVSVAASIPFPGSHCAIYQDAISIIQGGFAS